MRVLCVAHDLASGWLMFGAVLGTSLLYICLLVFRTSARLSTMAAVVRGLCWNQWFRTEGSNMVTCVCDLFGLTTSLQHVFNDGQFGLHCPACDGTNFWASSSMKEMRCLECWCICPPSTLQRCAICAGPACKDCLANNPEFSLHRKCCGMDSERSDDGSK